MLSKALQRKKSKPRLLPVVYSSLALHYPACCPPWEAQYSLYSHQNHVVSKHSKALSGILTCWSYLGAPGSFILQKLSNSGNIQMISEEPGSKISGSKFTASFPYYILTAGQCSPNQSVKSNYSNRFKLFSFIFIFHLFLNILYVLQYDTVRL